MQFGVRCISASLIAFSLLAQKPDSEFSEQIRPVLMQNCATCHNPAKAKGPAPFLKATRAEEMEADRGLWRNVAAQLRNRTMPPIASKLTEDDRLRIASWIDNRLRKTACAAGSSAGAAITRRLNRREYRNTIRELLGVDMEISAILPADGTGGSGFDTNGETLYVPPVLMERYLEAAQQILDRVLITPQIIRNVHQTEAKHIDLPVYLDSEFDIIVMFEGGGSQTRLALKIDGAEPVALKVNPRRIVAGKLVPGPLTSRTPVNLTRGSHTLELITDDSVTKITRFTITQKQESPTPEKRALHYRLLGLEPGQHPAQPEKAARQTLEEFVPKAFRRPASASEIDRFMAMYQRSAERGDPYEERIKLALKTVLVWPDFLFRIEKKHPEAGTFPLGQYELATRLSYFLWSTLPDQKLLHLAEEGKLQDSKVLAEQVERMLDDPRSQAFISSFIGQWLGTQDIGGRVVPLLTELQSFYTPETATDLRAQPILLWSKILGENRPLIELLTANYTHLTSRLAKYYQLEGQIPGLSDNEFKLVQWPDNHRAGILGLGGVLAMTSRYKETSPVLRGAWVLETLLGTPVPPPPPDVPPLKTDAEVGKKLGMREKLTEHRANPACNTCHRLMDPIGFGLENFDWMGQWRDKESDGQPIDASGELPSGDRFNGIVELRQALLNRKSEFVNNFASRVLGYALGRSLQDGDDCTIQQIVQRVEKDEYRARTLIREIVLSTPFRNTQGGIVHSDPVISRKSLDISGLNALKQDAASHNNQVKLPPRKTR